MAGRRGRPRPSRRAGQRGSRPGFPQALRPSQRSAARGYVHVRTCEAERPHAPSPHRARPRLANRLDDAFAGSRSTTTVCRIPASRRAARRMTASSVVMRGPSSQPIGRFIGAADRQFELLVDARTRTPYVWRVARKRPLQSSRAGGVSCNYGFVWRWMRAMAQAKANVAAFPRVC